jgi:MFS family permease
MFMLALVRPVFSLFAGVSLLLLGSGLLNTLLAIRGNLEGFSDEVMGFIMSGYFFGFFVGTFLALPVIRRVGHIRAFAMFAAIGSVSVLLHDIFPTPWAWGGLRVLTGIALVVLYTVVESWLNAQTPANFRGQVFAIYMVVNLAALALAQQFLQLAPASSYLLFVLAAILVTLSLVPVTGTRFSPPEVQNVQPPWRSPVLCYPD